MWLGEGTREMSLRLRCVIDGKLLDEGIGEVIGDGLFTV